MRNSSRVPGELVPPSGSQILIAADTLLQVSDEVASVTHHKSPWYLHKYCLLSSVFLEVVWNNVIDLAYEFNSTLQFI